MKLNYQIKLGETSKSSHNNIENSPRIFFHFPAKQKPGTYYGLPDQNFEVYQKEFKKKLKNYKVIYRQIVNSIKTVLISLFNFQFFKKQFLILFYRAYYLKRTLG